jgi:hypothetical protein
MYTHKMYALQVIADQAAATDEYIAELERRAGTAEQERADLREAACALLAWIQRNKGIV